MSEITKLRQRIKNISKTAYEYRMSVVEAKNLLLEIDGLVKPEALSTNKAPLQTKTPAAPIYKPQILDGGGFM